MELLTCEGDDYKPLEIQELIQKHHKVFQEIPMDLLLNMKIEQLIEIKPREKPVNIKLYRYPRVIKMWSHFKEQKPLCSSSSASSKEGWIFHVVHRLRMVEQDNNQE